MSTPVATVRRRRFTLPQAYTAMCNAVKKGHKSPPKTAVYYAANVPGMNRDGFMALMRASGFDLFDAMRGINKAIKECQRDGLPLPGLRLR